MGKVLVTGGAGFIGSHVAQALIDHEHRVVVVDNLSTGYKESVPSMATFIEASCQDESLYKVLDQHSFDAIIHMAGQSSGEVSFDDPVHDLRTNTESTLRLIRFGLTHGCSKFVYASSMSVYGTQPDRPVREDDIPQPLSFYGVGKLASEHYLRIYQPLGLRPTALRLFNVYGPGQNLANMRQGMLSIYLKYLLDGQRITVKGPLDRYRDFIYVDDVVKVFLEALGNDSFVGQVFNVGTGIKTCVRTLLEELCQCFGIPDHKSVVDIDRGTPGDQFGIFASVDKLKGTGACPTFTSLNDGLRAMVDWARSEVGQ